MNRSWWQMLPLVLGTPPPPFITELPLIHISPAVLFSFLAVATPQTHDLPDDPAQEPQQLQRKEEEAAQWQRTEETARQRTEETARQHTEEAAQWQRTEETARQQEETAQWQRTKKETVTTEFVDKALLILSRVPPSSNRSKPAGIVGWTMYYAQRAYVLLFLNGPQQHDSPSRSASSLHLPAAVGFLRQAANANPPHPDALFLLAEMNFHGNYSHPIDYDEAFRRYHQLAAHNGNRTAHYMLGLLYATGLSPAHPPDQARSMLHHVFAADQGDTRSQMTLAYRYHAGIATPRNCDEAVYWYRIVAEKAVAYYRSGPPGGHELTRDAYRLADEDGGVYGAGASASSSGSHARAGGPTSDANADVDDVLEYLLIQSGKGDVKATFTLARMHYEGTRDRPRDFTLAKKHFMTIARHHWTPSGSVIQDASPLVEKLAARSAGHLGRMFLRGEGMPPSFAKARIWFTRGASYGDALSHYSLGLMYLDGLGVARDVARAAEYLAEAADHDMAVAQTHLGKLFLDQGDAHTAGKYFELAARHGHIEALYYVAEMHDRGAGGRERSCAQAAVFYKLVAEKAEPVWSALDHANRAFYAGDRRTALVAYLMAAEQGCESAQFNVAWLLDPAPPRWDLLSLARRFWPGWPGTLGRRRRPLDHPHHHPHHPTLSLIHWARSARQHNIDSLLKAGDHHFARSGGVDGGSPSSPAKKAAAYYQTAADTGASAQALWNLGWMYENGLGLDQDFHLAKRFYDLAAALHPEARWPVRASLLLLRLRSAYSALARRPVPGVAPPSPPPRPAAAAPTHWLPAFLRRTPSAPRPAWEPDDWAAPAPDRDAPTTTATAAPAAPAPPPDGPPPIIDARVRDTFALTVLVLALLALLWYRQGEALRAEMRARAREWEHAREWGRDDARGNGDGNGNARRPGGGPRR